MKKRKEKKKHCSLYNSETNVYKMRRVITVCGVYGNAGKNTIYTKKTYG